MTLRDKIIENRNKLNYNFELIDNLVVDALSSHTELNINIMTARNAVIGEIHKVGNTAVTNILLNKDINMGLFAQVLAQHLQDEGLNADAKMTSVKVWF